MDPHALRYMYGRISPWHLLLPKINEEKMVWGNVLRKRIGTSPSKTQNSSVAKSGKNFPQNTVVSKVNYPKPRPNVLKI